MKNILIAIILCISSVQAATTDVERETKGFGSTYQEALSSALLEAVRQVRGLEVGTEKNLKITLLQTLNAAGSTVTGNAHVAEDIYTKSQGWIKSYKILEATEPKKEGAPWTVSVLVTVPVYEEVVKDDNRKTMAVLTFETAFKEIMTRNTRLAVDDIAERISEGVLSDLAQSKKFAAVNRSFETQFRKERETLKSGDAPASESSRVGQKLGADLIITGKIHSVRLEKKEKTFYGSSTPYFEAGINLYYAVIEAATEKVLWADTVDYEFSGKDEKLFVAAFISGLAESIASNVLDVTYPIKVLELQDNDTVLLNQGGKRLEVGQLLNVFTPGRSIKDADTNMPIVIDGENVAQIKVVDVLPNYSIAKIVSGSYEKIKENALTRRVKTEKQTDSAPAKPLTPGSSDKPWSWN